MFEAQGRALAILLLFLPGWIIDDETRKDAETFDIRAGARSNGGI
jgi:hypothetical protein